MLNVLRRKPIIQVEGSEDLDKFIYKYCHTGWLLNVEIQVFTDLTFDEFDNFCEGKYTREDVERFELTGKF